MKKTVTTDERIIELFFSRDEEAISLTDRTYGAALLHFLKGFLSLKEDREEVLSDIYLDTWNTIPPERPRVLYGFLLTITRRRAIDRLRRNNGKKQIPEGKRVPIDEMEEIVPDTSDVEDEILQKELAGLISQFIRTLDERRRFIFMSRYFALKKVSVISEELALSKSTVEKTLKSLREELREFLLEEGYPV